MSRWVDTDKQSLVESVKWAAKQIESKRGFIPPKYVFCSNDVEHEKRINHLKEQGYVQISENVWKLP